jgi:hypothetical protein
VIAAADANEVMREQLDFLIEHAQSGPCGCLQCERYIRARTLLLEAFRSAPEESQGAPGASLSNLEEMA